MWLARSLCVCVSLFLYLHMYICLSFNSFTTDYTNRSLLQNAFRFFSSLVSNKKRKRKNFRNKWNPIILWSTACMIRRKRKTENAEYISNKNNSWLQMNVIRKFGKNGIFEIMFCADRNDETYTSLSTTTIIHCAIYYKWPHSMCAWMCGCVCDCLRKFSLVFMCLLHSNRFGSLMFRFEYETNAAFTVSSHAHGICHEKSVFNSANTIVTLVQIKIEFNCRISTFHKSIETRLLRFHLNIFRCSAQFSWNHNISFPPQLCLVRMRMRIQFTFYVKPSSTQCDTRENVIFLVWILPKHLSLLAIAHDRMTANVRTNGM